MARGARRRRDHPHRSGAAKHRTRPGHARLAGGPRATPPRPPPPRPLPGPPLVQATPVPPLAVGYLTVASKPAARLTIDGRDTSRWTPVPPANPIALAAGAHTLVLETADGRKLEEQI